MKFVAEVRGRCIVAEAQLAKQVYNAFRFSCHIWTGEQVLITVSMTNSVKWPEK